MAKVISIIAIGFSFLFLKTITVQAAFRLSENGPKINGFIEAAFSAKTESDDTKRDGYNMLEERFQLRTTTYPEFIQLLSDWESEFNIRGDFTVDEYYAGKTDFQLRQLNLAVSPSDWIDIRVGRQIFTWGTGDYLFINDLFPKDYVSFYIGRDDEYLKSPSDGLKLSFYYQKANFDFIVIPAFEPNTIFTGDRVSFFDSFQGGIAAIESERRLIEPENKPKNFEYATRLYRNIGRYELAFYSFRGFYKMPRGYLNEANKDLFYPRLDAYGLSLRGPALGGIVNFEFGFYNSRQDTNGDNRLIENSMTKYLLGYDKDLGNDFKIGLQYLLEHTQNYDNYEAALLAQDFRWDEYRHLMTLRLQKLFKNQTVRTNLFFFFSPSDKDGYLRPSIDYDLTDNLKITLGANVAWGEDEYTEFGQMQRNKNVYLRIRRSF